MVAITVEGYGPEGLKISLSFEAKDLRQALAFSAAAAKAGVTSEPIESKEATIVTVMRREKIEDNGESTPIIDMYSAWAAGGKYGQFRVLGLYLNNKDEIREFEAQAGLKLDDIPLYASQVALQRKPNRPNPHETACKPFTVRKRFKGQKMGSDGKMQNEWEFIGYGSAAEPVGDDPAPAAPRAVLPMPGQLRPAAAPAPNVDQGAPLGGRRNR